MVKAKNINEWKKAVRQKDNNTCQRCGIFDNETPPHHFKPRSRYPELKLEIENGMVLCFNCHRYVHDHPKNAHENGYFYVGKYDGQKQI